MLHQSKRKTETLGIFHSIAFTAYNKTALARKVIEDLGAARVIASISNHYN